MAVHWWRKRRRRRLRAQAFPQAWQQALDDLPIAARLSEDELQRVRQYLQVFIPEKNWEGCRGFAITPQVQVTIAAQVAILVLGFDDQFFDAVESILVYPEAYVAPDQTVAGPGIILEGRSEREGEAWYRGPVILSWDDVVSAAHYHSGGHNLVLHEFAHQLDMLNGSVADGIPTLETQAEVERWTRVTGFEYQRLCREHEHGYRTLLDPYGTKNPAEFFAVATETFFELPQALRQRHPELYQLLRDFYRQDPAVRG